MVCKSESTCCIWYSSVLSEICLLHTFSAFWLRSSVVSVLLSLISEIRTKCPVPIWLGTFMKPSDRSLLWILSSWGCPLCSACRQTLCASKRDLGIAVPPRVAGIPFYILTLCSLTCERWSISSPRAPSSCVKLLWIRTTIYPWCKVSLFWDHSNLTH